MSFSPILTMELRFEHDVVLIRQRARQISSLLGFESQEQTRIATAVSEIARNAFQYAGGGKAEFLVADSDEHSRLVIRISDKGSGIPNLQEILDGLYVSRTGMGVGLIGARRLVDDLRIDTSSKGTAVTLEKILAWRKGRVLPAELARISAELMKQAPQSPFEEMQRQNHELLKTMAELRERQGELAELNRELEDTNRGVLALYSELDEKAESLRRANEGKTKFFSNMTHEFRTPLNSIFNISNLLLDGLDGELNPEQEKQVRFIQNAAQSLSDLVNDLLDLAKVEAGKLSVRASDLSTSEVVSALRGLMRPLMPQSSDVELVFEEPDGSIPLHTDEGKVAQILRNLVSNALKYTERGHVRLTVRRWDADHVAFEVEDTGIGIAPEDHEKIFQEFEQIESPLQKRTKGTGLGLPLTRRLAELLGGKLSLKSREGAGSTFLVILPNRYTGPEEASVIEPHERVVAAPSPGASEPDLDPAPALDSAANTALIIDDEEAFRYTLVRQLREAGWNVLQAASGREGLVLAQNHRPDLIFLDLVMPGLDGFEVLGSLMASPATRGIPVVVHTSKDLSHEERGYLEQVTLGFLPKGGVPYQGLSAQLREWVSEAARRQQKSKE